MDTDPSLITTWNGYHPELKQISKKKMTKQSTLNIKTSRLGFTKKKKTSSKKIKLWLTLLHQPSNWISNKQPTTQPSFFIQMPFIKVNQLILHANFLLERTRAILLKRSLPFSILRKLHIVKTLHGLWTLGLFLYLW